MHECKSDRFVETREIGGYPPGAEPGMMKTPARPGRPRRRGPTKIPVTIRLDADVLAALKESGPGWQTRANEVIRQWIIKEDRRTEDQ
ncbi:MAG: BrnA antitoxin family protein [Methylococcus sp.]